MTPGEFAVRWNLAHSLSLLIVFIGGWLVPSSGARGADQSSESKPTMVPLVSSGQSNAAIIAEEFGADGKKAVQDLSDYIFQSTGARLPIEQASAADRVEIHVGQTEYVKSLNLPSRSIEADGFQILFPADNRIVLIGGSPTGSEYAVYEFLERFVGVRWLFPGEQGTYVPKSRDIAIPLGDITSQPAYISRTISTMGCATEGESVYTWLQRHRRHWTIQHHHNFDKLFAPDEFYDSHPEFYPLVNGKREKPDSGGYGWQPAFGAPGIVDAAVAKISRYFDENPASISFSLGINDNNNFDVPAERQNSVGLGDYSDYYFTFANAVVEGVLKKHPDKWFGCLAYVGITDPPQESGVNPRIVPHICIDRFGWASEEHAQRDMKRTQDWHKVAPTLGWYDYIYGDDMYRVPRIYNHLMSRYVKFGSENGVRAMYAEYYGDPKAWIDGPKLYVFMKLLWDPNTDVDATVNEWYRLAVGDKAAEPLARYYQFWEDYWIQRVPKTDWFQQYANRVYMDFDHTGYLDELTPADLTQCKDLLQQVVAKAEMPEQKARATFIAKGFESALRDIEYVVRTKNRTEAPKGKAIIDDSFAPTSAQFDDKVPPPWGGWQNEPGTAKFSWDHRNGHNDTHSLMIDAANAGVGAIFYRDLPIEKPAKMYCLSAVAQANGINDDAEIGIELRWSKSDDTYIPRKYTGNRFFNAGHFKDGQWTPLSFCVRPPPIDGPYSVQVSMKINFGKKGIARFDDVRLIELDNEPE